MQGRAAVHGKPVTLWRAHKASLSSDDAPYTVGFRKDNNKLFKLCMVYFNLTTLHGIGIYTAPTMDPRLALVGKALRGGDSYFIL